MPKASITGGPCTWRFTPISRFRTTGAFTVRLDPAKTSAISHHPVRTGGKIYPCVEMGEILTLLARRFSNRRGRPGPQATSSCTPPGSRSDPIAAEALYPQWANFLRCNDFLVRGDGNRFHGTRLCPYARWCVLSYSDALGFDGVSYAGRPRSCRGSSGSLSGARQRQRAFRSHQFGSGSLETGRTSRRDARGTLIQCLRRSVHRDWGHSYPLGPSDEGCSKRWRDIMGVPPMSWQCRGSEGSCLRDTGAA